MVIVEYHPILRKEFIDPLDKIREGLTGLLLADFKRYIESDFTELPNYFGCENMYGSPPQYAGVMNHIHLCIPPDKFPKNVPQRDRRCKNGNPEKDIALVYVQGLENLDHYCILAVLMPNAHGMARNHKLMSRLGRAAVEFQEKH